MNDDRRDGNLGVREREPVAPEHPAIRERRRQVARDMGRRRRNRLALIAGAVLAVLVGYWLYTGPVLSVNGVTMRGYDRDDRAELLAALTAAGERGSIVSPPRSQMHTTAARFPWVERIHVARRWPRGLAVDVIQARPVAVGYAGEGDPVLLTRDGRVLQTVTGGTGLGWVRLSAVPPAAGGYVGEAETATLEFMETLAPDLAVQVRDLAPTPEGTVTGRLEQGPELRLGRPDRLSAKATALGLVLGALSPEDRAAATYIDLSVPEHPAVGGLGTATQSGEGTGDDVVDPAVDPATQEWSEGDSTDAASGEATAG